MGNVAVNTQPVVLPKEQHKKERTKHKQLHNTTYRVKLQEVEHLALPDLPYIAFLVTAVVIAFLLCINYVQCNSDVTYSVNQIKHLESKLFELKEENFTEENYINTKVNLIEIKERAINDLGMVYPEKGQIYFYKANNQDYVAQYATVK